MEMARQQTSPASICSACEPFIHQQRRIQLRSLRWAAATNSRLWHSILVGILTIACCNPHILRLYFIPFIKQPTRVLDTPQVCSGSIIQKGKTDLWVLKMLSQLAGCIPQGRGDVSIKPFQGSEKKHQAFGSSLPIMNELSSKLVGQRGGTIEMDLQTVWFSCRFVLGLYLRKVKLVTRGNSCFQNDQQWRPPKIDTDQMSWGFFMHSFNKTLSRSGLTPYIARLMIFSRF